MLPLLRYWNWTVFKSYRQDLGSLWIAFCSSRAKALKMMLHLFLGGFLPFFFFFWFSLCFLYSLILGAAIGKNLPFYPPYPACVPGL